MTDGIDEREEDVVGAELARVDLGRLRGLDRAQRRVAGVGQRRSPTTVVDALPVDVGHGGADRVQLLGRRWWHRPRRGRVAGMQLRPADLREVRVEEEVLERVARVAERGELLTAIRHPVRRRRDVGPLLLDPGQQVRHVLQLVVQVGEEQPLGGAVRDVHLRVTAALLAQRAARWPRREVHVLMRVVLREAAVEHGKDLILGEALPVEALRRVQEHHVAEPGGELAVVRPPRRRVPFRALARPLASHAHELVQVVVEADEQVERREDEAFRVFGAAELPHPRLAREVGERVAELRDVGEEVAELECGARFRPGQDIVDRRGDGGVGLDVAHARSSFEDAERTRLAKWMGTLGHVGRDRQPADGRLTRGTRSSSVSTRL